MARRRRKSGGKSAYAKAKKSPLGSGKRFRAIAADARRRGARNPNAVAAAAGRKKYGAKKMAQLAAAGRKRKARKRKGRKR